MKVKPILAALDVSGCRDAKRGGLHIKNTVSDDLGVDSDLVGTLGQSPDNGVSGPEADISTGNGLVWSRRTYMAVIKLRSQKSPLVFPPLFLVATISSMLAFDHDRRGLTGLTTDEQDVKDGNKGNARESVPSPLVPFTLGVCVSSDTSKQASDNHEDIGKDGEQGRGGRETSEDTKGNEEERSGEQPVNVPWISVHLLFGREEVTHTCVVDLSEEVEVVGVVAFNLGGDVGDTKSGSHGKVGDHGDGQDHSREPGCQKRSDQIYTVLTSGRS